MEVPLTIGEATLSGLLATVVYSSRISTRSIMNTATSTTTTTATTTTTNITTTTTTTTAANTTPAIITTTKSGINT
eukprot:9497777-Pyramimonas_sp.AAC.1